MRAIERLGLVLGIGLLPVSLARAQNANIAGNLSIGSLSPPTARLFVDDTAQADFKSWAMYTSFALRLQNMNSARLEYPFIQWQAPDGTRAGYLGWGSRATPKRIEFGLENGHNLYING